MNRLVVVSNRVPTENSAGGLAIGLQAAMQESNGLWFGWSGNIAEGAATSAQTRQLDNYTLATVDLDAHNHDGYYNGFANRALWPLFHARLDLASFEPEQFATYGAVNRQFATSLAPLLQDGDRIWVHDYHLIPLGRMLREAQVSGPLGFFLHIPFPAHEIMSAFPWSRDLVLDLLAYDLIGLQSRRDLRNLRDFVERELGGSITADGRITARGHTSWCQVFPIGIDVDRFARLAEDGSVQRRFQQVAGCVQGQTTMLGVDRLDYTKGLVERARAFEALLENYPNYHNRVMLLQIAAPSRNDVPEYVEIRHELERISGRVNGHYADLDWTPIRYFRRAYSQEVLAALYRHCRIGLVTPLCDGMNLVAKEYVASQDGEDPGVLVLSRFAGAAEQMEAALTVNPHDMHGVARTLDQALRMQKEERRERWLALMTGLQRDDVHAWRRRFLRRLEEVAAQRPGQVQHLPRRSTRKEPLVAHGQRRASGTAASL